MEKNRKARVAVLLLLSSALLLRLIVAVTVGPPIRSDSAEYAELAKNMVSGKGYSIDGKATAYRTPGYPLFLAPLFAITENPKPVRVVQALLETASCFLLFLIGRRLHSFRVGVIAMGIWCFFPLSIVQPVSLMTETFFTAALLGGLFLAFCQIDRRWWGAALLGILWGYAILIKPHCGIIVCLYVFRLLRSAPSYRWWAGRGILVLSGVVIMVVPWMVRNKVELGILTIGTNAGSNFWIGHNPDANGSYRFNSAHPLFAGVSEVEANRRGWREGLRFAKSHPLKECILTGKKLAFFFGLQAATAIELTDRSDAAAGLRFVEKYSKTPLWLNLVLDIPYMLLLLAASYSLFRIPVISAETRFLLACAAGWIAVHIVFFGAARFNYPLLPLCALFAAQGYDAIVNRAAPLGVAKRLAVGAVWLFFCTSWIAEVAILLLRTAGKA